MYTVTYDSQSATIDANPVSQEVIYPDTTVTNLPIPPTRAGYIFSGWYSGPNQVGSQFFATTPVTQNRTVYAYWKSNPTLTVKIKTIGSATGTVTSSV